MAYRQDTTGLDELRRELAAIPDEILKEAKAIVGKGMLNIKRGAQANVRVQRWAHLPHLARSFGYDVDTLQGGRVIRGVGGADMDKLQGKLDIYVENGTAHTPASAHWTRAFDAELPNFDRYCDELFDKVLP
jgi:hypothetical protein